MHHGVCSAFRHRTTRRSNQPKLSNQRPRALYQADFVCVIAEGQTNLGHGLGLIISVLVLNSEEVVLFSGHEKQTLPLNSSGLGHEADADDKL